MKLIVLSDTHSDPLPQALVNELDKADLIVHVGDFCDKDVLDELKAHQKVRAVYGNMDGLPLRQILPREDVFEVEGVRIALFHGEGHSGGMVERVRERFKGRKLRVIIFGHSHEAMNEEIEGVLLFNPGSPTDCYRAPYCSYGVLEIKNGTVKGKIVKLR